MYKAVNIHAGYGRLQVLNGVSLHVSEGECVALVGGNGAGKSTLLKTLAGLLRCREGRLLFDGHSVAALTAERRARAGIVMVPEGRGLFADMSVLDNLRMGTCSRCPSRREQRRRLEEICVLFPVLQERLHGKAGTLSGGQQQMLAVGRALMADPRVLLLDEPSTGLAPLLVADIFRKLRLLKQRGMTIILAEQHVREALRTADRAYVIENGRIVLDGPSAELMDSPDVKKAYLGL